VRVDEEAVGAGDTLRNFTDRLLALTSLIVNFDGAGDLVSDIEKIFGFLRLRRKPTGANRVSGRQQ
jgi:hypothetical protein